MSAATSDPIGAEREKPASLSAGANEAGMVTACQFVLFDIETETFALSLSEVQEIIRMPDMVEVPMSPRSLRGLANLRGTVMPVLSLREVFHFGERSPDDATRVVVLDQGHAVGLIVDRMANVVTVDADRIEPCETIRATVDTDFLTGMIKGTDGQSMVMILDAAQVVRREFSMVSAARAARTAERRESAPDKSSQTLQPVEDDQLVSFEVAGQEYAFPIERVKEIVQLPSAITHVPNAPPHVLGVITLRNRLLPLVSLRELFGLPAAELAEANKVVVVSTSGAQASGVGIVMDSVREVLRVSRSLVEPMPKLMQNGHRIDDIQSICRLENGKRLVSVLSADRLVQAEGVRKLLAENEDRQTMAQTEDDMAAGQLADEEQFVVFRLMNEEYGVPIEAVQEIVRVPDELTRVPNTPSFVEGVINLRGVVLPVIDQRRRFQLEGLERNDRQRIMVFTFGGAKMGFVVDSVSEVMRIPASAIGPAPDLAGEQTRLIRRVANLEKQKRIILLLDVMQLMEIREVATSKAA